MDNSTTLVTNFIEQHRPRLEDRLLSMGDTWVDLLAFLSFIHTSNEIPEPNHQEWAQVIIRGETDGTMGLETVKQLFVWNSKVTLILSGGVYGRERTIGDIGALDLYKHLENDLSLLGYHADDVKSRVLIDSLSRHTSDQGKILATLLRAIDAQEVFLVMPLYHMPRFILTLGRFLGAMSYRPRLIPLTYGNWSTHHPRKGPNHSQTKTFRYEELFALPPVPSRFAGKYDCGEIDKIAEQYRAGSALNIRQFLSLYQPGYVSQVQEVRQPVGSVAGRV